jgi:DNA repair protein RadC
MERPRRQPSQYQLGFDFGQRPDEASLADVMRFTYAVKEEVQVVSPEVAGAYLLSHVYTPFEAFEQEEVWLLLLDTKNRITHQSMIYRGTINTAQIRIAELYKPALRLNAASIIMSHCHPSSDVSPSPEDIRVTKLAYEAGELLGVKLIDHLIVGRGQWVSLKSLGVGFETT